MLDKEDTRCGHPDFFEASHRNNSAEGLKSVKGRVGGFLDRSRQILQDTPEPIGKVKVEGESVVGDSERVWMWWRFRAIVRNDISRSPERTEELLVVL
jgi:hypothetical protein